MTEKWKLVPISEIAERVSRPETVDAAKVYRLLGAHWYAKGLYVKDERPGMEIRANKLFAVEPGDFVYNRLFAWKGSFAMAEQGHKGCYVSNEFPCFELDRERIVPRFLWLYFSRESAWLEALGLSSGSTPTSRNRLKEDQFLQMQIPLPPIGEQRRIVARIEELVALVEEAQGLRGKAREEAQAFWESSLASTFGQLYEIYPRRAFRDICDVVRGGSPRPAGSPLYYDGPIPFLKVADLTKDSNKFVTDYRATIKEIGLSKSRYVEPYTLMLTNSGATLGVPKICTFATCFNDGIQAFLNLAENISKEYLYYFLRSKTRWFREHAARGQGQPNLNTGMVKEVEFPLSPLAQQLSIVAYLDDLKTQLDEFTALQDATQAEVDALLPSVLDRAFRGEL